ncbi:MAG: hypothetical protein K0R54_2138 [Clostridiaceae bacterium]|nr:hypothetical protein [Clostridiaceae bacterium]
MPVDNESLNTLKDVLGIERTDITKDTILNFSLDDATTIIINHCHIDEVPTGLFTTFIRMARDIYLNENLGSEAVALGSISSIQEGNTTTQFRSNAAELKDSLIRDYKKQLNTYRVIKWT